MEQNYSQNNEQNRNPEETFIKRFKKNLPLLIMRNSIWIMIILYLLIAIWWCKSLSDFFSGRTLIMFIIFVAIGALCSSFYKKFEQDEEKAKIDFGNDAIPEGIHEQQGIKHKIWEKQFWLSLFEMSGWDYLRIGLTILFLFANWWIMHQSIASLWLTESFFCWFLSLSVILVLFWITGFFVYKIPQIKRGSRVLFIGVCVALYILFDIAAFTFNYFHIYSNFGQTQQMAKSVKISDNFVKYVIPLIETERNATEIKLKEIATRNKENFENYEMHEANERFYNGEVRKYSAETSENKTTNLVAQIDSITTKTETTKTETSYEKMKKNLAEATKKKNEAWNKISQEDRDSLMKFTPLKEKLDDAFILCQQLNNDIEKFKMAKNTNDSTDNGIKFRLKNDIVENMNLLYGRLRDTTLKNDTIAIHHLCQQLNNDIENFKMAKNTNDRTDNEIKFRLKNDIVENMNVLYGRLQDNILKNDTIAVHHLEVINAEEIDIHKALSDLLELITPDAYNKRNSDLVARKEWGKKEIHDFERKISIHSILLSALIDLAPILFALFAGTTLILSLNRKTW
jgi:hypothetical protein